MSLKSRVKGVSPKWIVRAFRRLVILREFLSDYRYYAKATDWERGSHGRSKQIDLSECVNARTVLAYHGLEKGMTFPVPRRPFGLARRGVITDILESRSSELLDDAVRKNAESALAEHATFNSTGVISSLLSPFGPTDIMDRGDDVVSQFVSSRHSVRNFANVKVDDLLIEEIVRNAGLTPSVCNRRSYRAHVFEDRNDIDNLLALQNGNAGFGDTVPLLVVVTERRSAFMGSGERNQRWVDGGLFAMSLVWIAHARGLGSCFLNWSQTNERTRVLRARAGISEAEDVVVLIAMGYPAEGYRVARSPERGLNDILVLH